MAKYKQVQVRIPEEQKRRMREAFRENRGTTIKLDPDDLKGNEPLAVTHNQFKRYLKAVARGEGLKLGLNRPLVQYNSTVEGGFLSALAGLAARALPMVASKVLPALGIGALSGLASTGVEKIFGSGLFLKKGGCICRVDTDGEHLILSPTDPNDPIKAQGDGLFIRKGGIVYSGNGIILGPNSPFNNIPLLGAIL